MASVWELSASEDSAEDDSHDNGDMIQDNAILSRLILINHPVVLLLPSQPFSTFLNLSQHVSTFLNLSLPSQTFSTFLCLLNLSQHFSTFSTLLHLSPPFSTFLHTFGSSLPHRRHRDRGSFRWSMVLSKGHVVPHPGPKAAPIGAAPKASCCATSANESGTHERKRKWQSDWTPEEWSAWRSASQRHGGADLRRHGQRPWWRGGSSSSQECEAEAEEWSAEEWAAWKAGEWVDNSHVTFMEEWEAELEATTATPSATNTFMEEWSAEEWAAWKAEAWGPRQPRHPPPPKLLNQEEDEELVGSHLQTPTPSAAEACGPQQPHHPPPPKPPLRASPQPAPVSPPVTAPPTSAPPQPAPVSPPQHRLGQLHFSSYE